MTRLLADGTPVPERRVRLSGPNEAPWSPYPHDPAGRDRIRAALFDKYTRPWRFGAVGLSWDCTGICYDRVDPRFWGLSGLRRCTTNPALCLCLCHDLRAVKVANS